MVNELREPTQPRINSVIGAAIGAAFVIYMVVACCGYATYGTEVESDILTNYPGLEIIHYCHDTVFTYCF